MSLTVPRERVEQGIQTGGGSFDFPEGEYEGVIEDVRVRDMPAYVQDRSEFAERVRTKNNGWETPDIELLGIQIGQIEVLELVGPDDIDVGDRKMFVPDGRSNLTVRDGSHTIDNIDPTDGDVPYWKLRQGAEYVAMLGYALKETTEENGQVTVRDGFLEDLKAGALEGRGVGFEIVHTGTYEKQGEERIDWKVKRFFPAPTLD